MDTPFPRRRGENRGNPHRATSNPHHIKSNSIVIGPEQAQDELYVAATIRLRNPLRVPVTIDDVTCTLTDAAGAEMTVSAVSQGDLHLVEMSFPQLKPVVGKPLFREAAIAPAQEADGTLLFPFPLTKKIWQTRKSAILTLTLYHRDPLTLTLPKECER